jgi:hypothetical protein
VVGIRKAVIVSAEASLPPVTMLADQDPSQLMRVFGFAAYGFTHQPAEPTWI